jgi:hypothetical protein
MSKWEPLDVIMLVIYIGVFIVLPIIGLLGSKL